MPHGWSAAEELTEWSRHYDTLIWGVITIFLAAIIGRLLAYSFGGGLAPLPEIAGLVLTGLGVFYVARFHRFRHELHSRARMEVFLFLDEGAVANRLGDLTSDGWHTSYGVGVRFATVPGLAFATFLGFSDEQTRFGFRTGWPF